MGGTRKLKMSLVISVFLLAMGPAVAAGGTIYVDADASSGGDGTSWGTAYKYLQDALYKPPTGGDEIWVAEGSYKPDEDEGGNVTLNDRYATFQLIDDVGIYGGFPSGGDPNWNDRDPNAYETILSGDLNSDDEPNFVNNSDNSYHVVTGSGTNATAILDGFTITAGNASGTFPSPTALGGGMYNNSGSPTVTNCTFSRNTTVEGCGGGMYNDQSSPTVTDCTFSGNTGSYGGGMYNDQSNPTVTNCTFIANTRNVMGIYASGGGMANRRSSPVLTNCTFSGNSTPNGAGMWNSSSSPTLSNCAFSGNSADEGGGMKNNVYSSPTLTNCTFSGNSANYGGGMRNSGGSPTLTNCTFSGNSANYGGGMYNEDSNPTMTDCTLIGNTAEYGGGMYNFDGSSPTLASCTFSGNSAVNNGGGMNNYDNSNPILNHCTFNDNQASSGGGMLNYTSNPNLSNCTFNVNTANYGGGMCNDNYSSPILSNCTFSGNSADYGGGMHNGDHSSPVVTNCMFRANSASSKGSGMCNHTNSSPTVTNCTFTGNSSARSGGGMYNELSSSPTVTNCTFGGNSATDEGGGMYNELSSSPTVTNCTFGGNSATDEGGGMYNYDSNPTLSNCILWGNIAATGPEIYNDGTSSPTVDYCCVQSWPGGGTGNIADDPLFVDPNGPDDIAGTEDDNLRLLASSPCIDAGDNTAVPGGVTTDLDGNPRFVDIILAQDSGKGFPPIVDIGAYEVDFQQGFIIVGEPVEVTEGGIRTFTVALALDPLAEVTVTVVFLVGDPDISVQSGSMMTFDSSNFSQAQPVTLACSEDADFINGRGVIRISAFNVPSYNVTAIEVDNEPVQPVLFVDKNASGANSGFNWSDALTDLQDALTGVVGRPGVSQILVAEGIYKPDQGGGNSLGDRGATFQLINGVTIKGGYAGAGANDPNERDIKLYETILSGDLNGDDDPNFVNNTENSYHVVTGIGTNETTLLDGLIVMAGNTTGGTSEFGGGMYLDSSSPVIMNCTFSSNYANNSGGAMVIYSGSTVIMNCTFSSNYANNSGGAMVIYSGSTVIEGCIFDRNHAAHYGGGVFDSRPAYDYDKTTLKNCVFTRNTSGARGGGIYSRECTLIQCTFTQNAAWQGGGAYFEGVWDGPFTVLETYPTVISSAFIGNTAESGGGAICNYVATRPILINCEFAGNYAGGDGGAIIIDAVTPFPANIYLSITNCSFTGNKAGNIGGACAIFNDNISETTITNTILWANGASPQVTGGTLIVTSSCIQDDDPNDANIPFGGAANNNIDDNPTFVRDPNDGGDGWGVGDNDDFGDLHLLYTSPCIDAADNTSLPPDTADLDDDGNTSEPTPWDLDSRRRITDGDCNQTDIVDMGTYEFAYRYFGDFDGDCKMDVDFRDFAIFALAWLTEHGDGGWNPDCDISIPADNSINTLDLAVVVKYWLLGVE